MVNAVGGQVLELQEDRWIKQGLEQGLEQGLKQGIGQGIDIGKITARYEDGMPIDQIAAKMNIPEDAVIDVLKNAGMLN